MTDITKMIFYLSLWGIFLVGSLYFVSKYPLFVMFFESYSIGFFVCIILIQLQMLKKQKEGEGE